MIKRLKASSLLVSVLFISNMLMAQTVTPESPKKEEDEFAKKKVETKLTEVIPTDSVPASELVLRAINWIKEESDLYKKTSGANTSGKAECTVSFPVKPKELNPQFDYTGKISMKVVIECKTSKYKYTVSEIKHISKSGNTSGGSIDNKVPECGSMGLDDIVWKKLKGEALRGAAQVVIDLKAGMAKLSTDVPKDEW
jgi:hypothetical protein